MKTQSSCADLPCDRPIAERPRYYPRQLITSEDLTLEQDYFRSKLRAHNRYLHGWGVVCGAQVSPALKSGSNNEAEPWKVTVSRGYVLGPYGDEINLDCDRVIDVRTSGVMGITGDTCVEAIDPWCGEVLEQPEEGGPLYVAVRYQQLAMRPVRVQPIACGCDDTRCENSRWRDGYEIAILRFEPECYQDAPDIGKAFEASETPECLPCPDEPWVVLAQLTVDSLGTVTVDNCACRRNAVSFMNLWWVCGQVATAECQKVDEYGELSSADETTRLLNVATILQNNSTFEAVIIAYGKTTGEGQTRGTSTRDLLVNTHHVDTARITVIDGGVKTEFKTELWTCPPGAPRPTPNGSGTRMTPAEEKVPRTEAKGGATASKRAARKRGRSQ